MFAPVQLRNRRLGPTQRAAPSDLFREGHSAVVEGFVRPLEDPDKEAAAAVTEKARGIGCFFSATEVLAKHDEKYMPAEVAKAIDANKKKIAAAASAAEAQDEERERNQRIHTSTETYVSLTEAPPGLAGHLLRVPARQRPQPAGAPRPPPRQRPDAPPDPPDPIDSLNPFVFRRFRRGLLSNYSSWCSYLGQKSKIWLPEPNPLSADLRRELLYAALYLLIWGESANLRFMPECICYIYHHMVSELNRILEDYIDENTGGPVIPSTCRENGFLNLVMMPVMIWFNWPFDLGSSFFVEKGKGRSVGKTGFVEQRSFWNVFRSFDSISTTTEDGKFQVRCRVDQQPPKTPNLWFVAEQINDHPRRVETVSDVAESEHHNNETAKQRTLE
ncbi:hypothetical protein Scep_016536 [Stephania cephalantha]|uniref:1,3-beta-glucan synthase component FKS1-like domain-containing protein n=1 Tax=Stephania cephalantha TaxID=152367 RepID=A0AAP0IP33_9MAGN